jgi:hyperosmotically inducible periplasmic protein
MRDQGWIRGRMLSVLLAASFVLPLAACTDRTANESAGQQLDSAVDKTKKATAAAAEKAAELAETARDKTKAYLSSPEVKQDAAAMKDAVKNLGSAAVTTTDDAAITMSVSSALAKDPELNAAHIDVQTKDGTVRLAGAAPTASAKARAGEIAKGVKGVGTVDNALEVRAM